MIQQYIWLILVGFAIGAYGTLVGAGGGFVLVPILLLLYPKENPETITSISLAVVFFNALSGSVAYACVKRIEYKSGIILSAAAIPGAILGALTTAYIPRRIFDVVFGLSLIAASAFLMLSPKEDPENKTTRDAPVTSGGIESTPARFFNNSLLAVGLSICLGFISSLLGIGAGFLYVPVFIYFLDFPVHIATATSQFILTIMAFTGSATHVVSGMFHHGIRRTISLAIGVILGAQLGARISEYVQGGWIIRGLAIALGFVGVRLIVMAL